MGLIAIIFLHLRFFPIFTHVLTLNTGNRIRDIRDSRYKEGEKNE